MTQRGHKLASYGSESLAWLEHTSSQQAAGHLENPESYTVLSCSARGRAAGDEGGEQTQHNGQCGQAGMWHTGWGIAEHHTGWCASLGLSSGLA